MTTVQVVHPAAGVSTVKVVHGSGVQVVHPAAAPAAVHVVYGGPPGPAGPGAAITVDPEDGSLNVSSA